MKKFGTMLMTLCFSTLLPMAGCGLEDDISSGKAFLEAFPAEDTLIIETNGLDSQSSGIKAMSQALVGERADLHDLSFYVAHQINHQAQQIFRTVWFITRFAPTVAVEEDGILGEGKDAFAYNARAAWGPFRDDEGKNLEFILQVWRGLDPTDGRRVFAFFAAGRPLGGGEGDWVPFLYGGAKPFDGQAGEILRHGLVEVDCDALRQLDPNEDNVGQVTYAYIRGADYRVVAAVGEGIWADQNQDKVTDTTYFYGHTREDYTVLEFDTQADIETSQGPAPESLHIVTGWLKNGTGRSDAQVEGGDLGTASAQLTECWGIDLQQTYFHLRLDEVSQIEDGNAQSCMVADPIEVPAIDYQALRDLFDLDI